MESRKDVIFDPQRLFGEAHLYLVHVAIFSQGRLGAQERRPELTWRERLAVRAYACGIVDAFTEVGGAPWLFEYADRLLTGAGETQGVAVDHARTPEDRALVDRFRAAGRADVNMAPTAGMPWIELPSLISLLDSIENTHH